jgi:hypothetical protein
MTVVQGTSYFSLDIRHFFGRMLPPRFVSSDKIDVHTIPYIFYGFAKNCIVHQLIEVFLKIIMGFCPLGCVKIDFSWWNVITWWTLVTLSPMDM